MAITGTFAQRFRLLVVLRQLFHRTMLYAFTRLQRGVASEPALSWLSARIMPILANIAGPFISATRINASMAANHSGVSCSNFNEFAPAHARLQRSEGRHCNRPNSTCGRPRGLV